MPLENDLDKILIIGSGPTLVGSVAEMDLLANQAITALVEEGIHVVLVNPNPATISTDKRENVTVYLEPMTLSFLKRILRMEEPDAIMTAYGSTSALKIAHKLMRDGILQEMGIRLLTLNKQALAMDNQQKRSDFLNEINVGVNQTWHLNKANPSDFIDHLRRLGEMVSFPVLVNKHHRYVHNEHLSFKEPAALNDYFKKESQSETFSWKDYRLTEDLSSWEEIIVNLLRDHTGNVLLLNVAGCIEPVGINAGDSATVMPALTLNNDHVQTLRQISRKIAAKLDLTGILSIHFAVRHHGTQMETKVLNIKPRLTRSAVWIERAGLYSVGYILAKIAIGYGLNEITDPVSGLNASIEPTLDAVAIKMPYWSLSDSGENHYHLGKRMQASGEAMGIGQNFESAFLKAIASTTDLDHAWSLFTGELAKNKEEILADLRVFDEKHLLRLLAAIAKGMTYQELRPITCLHPVYYQKLRNIITLGQRIKAAPHLTAALLLAAKRRGFSNSLVAKMRQVPLHKITALIQHYQIKTSFLQIDGSAGVYHPERQCFYSAYGVHNEVKALPANKKVLLVGMLPLQVSVTSEFDYMIAHATRTLHKNGYATVMLSNNDESIASALPELDRLYFDPITVENILMVARIEHIKQVVVQFAGKKISALTAKLAENGLQILGEGQINPRAEIDQLLANDRFLRSLSLQRVPSIKTKNEDQIFAFAQKYGFPLLIGGFIKTNKQKSAVVYDLPAIKKYLRENKPEEITASLFIEGSKYEVTAISDGCSVTIPGIIEHLEQTGSHASDSIAVFPSQSLSKTERKHITQATLMLIKKLHLRGIFNLHFLEVGHQFYLLQIKPYAGHNVAFLSKAVGKDITDCAMQTIMGAKLPNLGFKEDLWPHNNFIYVKMPVFSYIDYSSDNTFDAKMKSSGSVIGRDTQLAKALYKGYEASDLHIPRYGTIFVSVRDEDKKKVTALAKRFDRLGFKFIATEGTANSFAEAGITTGIVAKVHDDPHNLLAKIRQHRVVMVINVTNLSDTASEDATRIRDQALKTHIPVFSSIETTALILKVLEALALTTQPI